VAAENDDRYMRRAIDWATKGETDVGGGPIGCVIVLDGQIIGEGHNEVFANNDATAHGEMSA
jgi:tRNA(Arg) A34 adenosine deaminase TadA